MSTAKINRLTLTLFLLALLVHHGGTSIYIHELNSNSKLASSNKIFLTRVLQYSDFKSDQINSIAGFRYFAVCDKYKEKIPKHNW